MLASHPNTALQDAANNEGVVRDLSTMINGHDLNSGTWSDAGVKAASRIDSHFSAAPPSGHMYEVNINAPPEHFLDWDKPLSEQSQHVQDTLGQLGITPPPKYSVRSVDGGHVVDFQHGDQQWTVPRVYQSADEAARQAEITKQLMSGNPTGREVLDYLIGPGQQGRVAAHADAADILRDAGIPGIRYLDAGSRAGGEGTRNTVIFDPATIEILRKYGIAGLMAGGAGAIAGTQQPQQ
jgi:hypothetical protein